MGRVRQTLERRQLGLTLRRLRAEAGKSQQEAAQAIGKVRSRVGDLEDGKSTAKPEILEALLAFYGVHGEERETVLALGAEARKRQGRRAYMDLLPGSFERFADLEASAVEINCYETGIIPGLLQSPGYVQALIDEGDGVLWDPSLAGSEQRIAFRLGRQERVLAVTEPKTLHFVLTEDSLRAVVGSQEVMHEQLRHLMRSSYQDGITMQVLSQTAPNPARGGAFTVFSFGDKGTPIGYSATILGSSAYYHDEADTAAMMRTFDRLRDLALSPAQSRRLVDGILEGS